MSPATEAPIQPEVSSIDTSSAKSDFKITQPVAGNVDPSGKKPSQHTSTNQDKPYVTCVYELLQ